MNTLFSSFIQQKTSMEQKTTQYIFPSLFVICCIYILNLQLDFYIEDPAIYGVLSKRILLTGDFSLLILDEKDWLDKPHLPFWITAISFKIFGISSFAYLLPITMALGLTFLYTFKFASQYYHKTIAWFSVFILSTAQYTMMSGTEGRIEPYLMCFIIGSIYHFDRGISHNKIIDFVIGSTLVAAAIMTKGMFVIVPIFGAIGGHLLYQHRNITVFFKWYWLLVAALICLFILPEIYALFIQFDSHPNKIIFGQKGISGIKWFLWDSQFSRLINTGPFTRHQGDYFFFIHTLLWAFFPWCFVLYYGFFQTLKKIFKKEAVVELYTFSGGLFMFLLFSISKFQLPHYISIVFPFYAIIVADIFYKPLNRLGKKLIVSLQTIQISVVFLVLISILIISSWSTIACLLFLSLFVGALLINFRRPGNLINKLLIGSGLAAIFLNAYMSLEVYPTISSYRADIQAARYINEHFQDQSVTVLGPVSYRFQFYCNSPISKYWDPTIQELQDLKKASLILCTDVDILKRLDPNYVLVESFDHYASETISLAFLNPKSRSTQLVKYILMKKPTTTSKKTENYQ